MKPQILPPPPTSSSLWGRTSPAFPFAPAPVKRAPWTPPTLLTLVTTLTLDSLPLTTQTHLATLLATAMDPLPPATDYPFWLDGVLPVLAKTGDGLTNVCVEGSRPVALQVRLVLEGAKHASRNA